jgi:hypothetical protein
MNEIAALSWRAYPAAALMAAGASVALRGLYRGLVHGPDKRAARRLLDGLGGFRLAVVGLSLLGVGAAWMWTVGWLLGLSLIIGGEELLESTVLIAALRNGLRHEH